MLRIAVCDNDLNFLNQLSDYIDDYKNTNDNADIEADYFTSPYQLLQQKEKGRLYQIYFLDIIMPGMDGISLAKQLRSLSEDALIIFITSSPDYALTSFHVSPYQYLLKPLSRDAFFQVLNPGIGRLMKSGKMIAVKTAEGMVTVYLHNLVFAEYKNHVIFFHLADGQTLTSVHIRISFGMAAAPLLADERFLRPHKSYIVNLDFVRKYTIREFTLSPHAVVPISQKCIQAVQRDYFDYLARHSCVIPTISTNDTNRS